MPRTYYEILNINRDASGDDIKIAYRKLALQFHPDRAARNGLDPKIAEASFKELNTANETLSDTIRRRLYDLTLPRSAASPMATDVEPKAKHKRTAESQHFNSFRSARVESKKHFNFRTGSRASFVKDRNAYYGRISTYPLHNKKENPIVVQEPSSTTFHLRMYARVLWSVKNYGSPEANYEASYFNEVKGIVETREIGEGELEMFNAAILDFIEAKKATADSKMETNSATPEMQSMKHEQDVAVEPSHKPIVNDNESLKAEIKSLYQLLDSKIAEKFKMAKDSGKKIIIAVGENHTSRKSLLIELLVLRLAKKYGINTLAGEPDPQLLEHIRGLPITAGQPNFSFALSMAEKWGMRVVAVDNNWKASDLVRNTCMKNGLVKLDDHCVFIAGVNHLYPVVMSSPEMSSKYEVLSINAMNLTAQELSEFRSISSYQACLLDLHFDPTEFVQAEIKTELMSQSGFAMISLVGEALKDLLPRDEVPLYAEERVGSAFFDNYKLRLLITKYGLPGSTQDALEKGLRLAANNDNVDDLRVFIKYVHNVNAVDPNPTSQKTALYWATLKGHKACCELLLAAGATYDGPVSEADGMKPTR